MSLVRALGLSSVRSLARAPFARISWKTRQCKSWRLRLADASLLVGRRRRNEGGEGDVADGLVDGHNETAEGVNGDVKWGTDDQLRELHRPDGGPMRWIRTKEQEQSFRLLLLRWYAVSRAESTSHF